MAIIKSIPAQRLIHGRIFDTSEVSIVSEKEYSTSGENCIIVRGVAETTVTLNSTTTDHVVIKAMNPLTVKPDNGKIDEDYDEIVMDKGACVEFRLCANTWYILSSDGLKQS